MSTRLAQDAMMEWAAQFKEIQQHPEDYSNSIRITEQRLMEAVDPRLQAHIFWSLTVERHQFENLTAIDPQIPHQSFDTRLDIYGSDALVRVLSRGAGHTDSDSILLLPENKVAFIGDLGFFKTHPYLGSSTPERWIATLDELANSSFKIFIPGHGPIGTKNDLLALKAYLLTLQSMVVEVIARGGDEEEAAAQPIPQFAENWAGFGRFEQSMRFLYRRQMEAKASDLV
jgi:glyoxylase-like metal-dependent hydrolase (beta-lactamase superfamily II)